MLVDLMIFNNFAIVILAAVVEFDFNSMSTLSNNLMQILKLHF